MSNVDASKLMSLFVRMYNGGENHLINQSIPDTTSLWYSYKSAQSQNDSIKNYSVSSPSLCDAIALFVCLYRLSPSGCDTLNADNQNIVSETSERICLSNDIGNKCLCAICRDCIYVSQRCFIEGFGFLHRKCLKCSQCGVHSTPLLLMVENENLVCRRCYINETLSTVEVKDVFENKWFAMIAEYEEVVVNYHLSMLHNGNCSDTHSVTSVLDQHFENGDNITPDQFDDSVSTRKGCPSVVEADSLNNESDSVVSSEVFNKVDATNYESNPFDKHSVIEDASTPCIIVTKDDCDTSISNPFEECDHDTDVSRNTTLLSNGKEPETSITTVDTTTESPTENDESVINNPFGSDDSDTEVRSPTPLINLNSTGMEEILSHDSPSKSCTTSTNPFGDEFDETDDEQVEMKDNFVSLPVVVLPSPSLSDKRKMKRHAPLPPSSANITPPPRPPPPQSFLSTSEKAIHSSADSRMDCEIEDLETKISNLEKVGEQIEKAIRTILINCDDVKCDGKYESVPLTTLSKLASNNQELAQKFDALMQIVFEMDDLYLQQTELQLLKEFNILEAQSKNEEFNLNMLNVEREEIDDNDDVEKQKELSVKESYLSEKLSKIIIDKGYVIEKLEDIQKLRPIRNLSIEKPKTSENLVKEEEERMKTGKTLNQHNLAKPTKTRHSIESVSKIFHKIPKISAKGSRLSLGGGTFRDKSSKSGSKNSVVVDKNGLDEGEQNHHNHKAWNSMGKKLAKQNKKFLSTLSLHSNNTTPSIGNGNATQCSNKP